MFELFSNQDLFGDVIFSDDFKNVYEPSANKEEFTTLLNYFSTLNSYISDLVIMSYTLPLIIMNASFSSFLSTKLIA
ncbi:hypothetical protein BC833DRAFT_577994 [Globomyces pollinis-pini]|nr:hypothetical protein BC833DRAFT_577994 [Globomyces pollinis-pini]